MGEQVEEPSALGDVPAVPFNQVQSGPSLEDVLYVLLLIEVAEAVDPASLPHFHPGPLRLWMKVEKDPLRSKRAMDPPQGVDRALQFNTSQRVGEDATS